MRPEAWAEAERDSEGDVRIVVVQREGALPDRAAERLSRRGVGRVGRSFRHLGGDVVKVRPERLAEVIAELDADPDVASFAPDRKDQRVVGQFVPWGVARIHAAPADRGTRSGRGVRVAVVDTGIWRSEGGAIHPDLAAAYRGGYDFVNGDTGPWDDHGHGTHVAGILAATDNAAGVVGVAPGVSLFALKVLDASGSGYYSDFIAALDWCIEHGIRIVNYSAGGLDPWGPVETACERARAAGITIVAAAGNEAGALLYPAAYASVVSVGSTGRTNTASWFSNLGAGLDLVAPGEEIRSTFIGGGYAAMSGTSMAAPHVAGAAALLATRRVTYPDTVQEYLQSTATDLGPAGHDVSYGHGLVDATAWLPPGAGVLAPLPGEIVPSGGDATVSWEAVPGAASYRVLFSRGSGVPWVVVADAVAGTSAAWDVPVVGPALSSGRIQVAAHGADGGLLAVSTRLGFSVRSLVLTAPAGATAVTGGSKLRIAWQVHATPRPVSAIAVERSLDAGATWSRLRLLAAAARAFTWTTPVVGAERRERVRVVLLDAAGAPVSSVFKPVTLLAATP